MKYPSIEQFRHVIRNVRDWASFNNQELPKINYYGTVKIHGTNAGIRCNEGAFSFLSRNRELQFNSDNAGFMNFYGSNPAAMLTIDTLRKRIGASDLTLFGEWCGPGIQQGVAVNQLPNKIFIVFSLLVDGEWEEGYKDLSIVSEDGYSLWHDLNIYFINEFPTWQKEIDFNKPEFVQNELVELTLEVERECPVGKFFNISGVGEGIVWKPSSDSEFNNPKFWFKAKGDKHSTSKVAKIVEIDAEAIFKRDELITAICTENRLKQGIQEHKLAGHSFEMKDISHYLRWVFNDVIKEESDRIEVSGFTQKELSKGISDVAKRCFIQESNSTMVKTTP
jgi:hypothetical protein